MLFLLTATTSFAQFTYERKIEEVKQAGWYQLTLPENIFPKLNSGFSDLRIFSNNDTTEIPYLLKIAEDQVARSSLSLKPLNLARKGTALYFTVKLNRTEPVNSALLEFVEHNYDSEVIVEGSNNQQEWFKLHNSRIISIANPPVNYQYNHIPFPNTDFNYLRFTISKGASLTLSQVKFYQTKITKGTFTEAAPSLTTKTANKQSEFYLTFAQPVLLSRLSVEPATTQPFYRNIQIDWLSDSIASEKGMHYQYQSLYSGVISSFQNDTLHFTPQVVSKVRITIYNQDNPPVQLKKVTGWSPQVILITNLQPGAYTLKYGATNVFHPRYDIEHFAKEIPEALPELQLSSELKPLQNTKPESNAWFKNKLWMWAALGTIVVILGFFTIRMIREQ